MNPLNILLVIFGPAILGAYSNDVCPGDNVFKQIVIQPKGVTVLHLL